MSVDTKAPDVSPGLNRAEVEQLDFGLHQGAKLGGVGAEVADRVETSLRSRAMDMSLSRNGVPRTTPITIAELFAEPKEQLHGQGSIVAGAVSASSGAIGSDAVAAEAERHIRGAVPEGGQATEDMIAAAKYSARGINESAPGREQAHEPGKRSHRQALAEPQAIAEDLAEKDSLADKAASPLSDKNREQIGLPSGIKAKGDFARLQDAIKSPIPMAEDDGIVELDPQRVAETLEAKAKIRIPTALESALRSSEPTRAEVGQAASLKNPRPTEIPSILASTETEAKIGPDSAPLLAAKTDNNVTAFRLKGIEPEASPHLALRRGLDQIIAAKQRRVQERLEQAA